MNIALTTGVQGDIDIFYNKLKLHEKYWKEHFSWVLCVGDFGIWPDSAKMDRASRKHDCGEFADYYFKRKPLPIQTLTISGVNEDHNWLKERKSRNNTELLPNLFWLPNGFKTTIGEGDVSCRVTGFGKVYSERSYNDNFFKKSFRHYTKTEIEKACSSGPTDILLLYEHIDCPGIRNLIYATRPKLIVNIWKPNKKAYTEVQKIPVIALQRKQVEVYEI